MEEREARLAQIRREAMEQAGRAVEERSGGQELQTATATGPGYYGQPVLKAPAWTWEVPIYFFVGGAAGAAAVLGPIARWSGAEEELVRDARYVAAIGGMISPALLVADLGYPRRFLNMLRVFKPQSAMSMGSWTLVAFSTSAAGAAFLSAVQKRPRGILRVFRDAGEMTAALSGTVLATYTGVLIGATAVPVWHRNIGILPIHFATAGAASAAAILELRGHTHPALNVVGMAACAGETLIGAKIELDTHRENDPLHKGTSGWLIRAGGVLSGPLPLALRWIAGNSRERSSMKLRKAAAVCSIVGSLLTRKGWIEAGKASAGDGRLELEKRQPIADS